MLLAAGAEEGVARNPSSLGTLLFVLCHRAGLPGQSSFAVAHLLVCDGKFGGVICFDK